MSNFCAPMLRWWWGVFIARLLPVDFFHSLVIERKLKEVFGCKKKMLVLSPTPFNFCGQLFAPSLSEFVLGLILDISAPNALLLPRTQPCFCPPHLLPLHWYWQDIWTVFLFFNSNVKICSLRFVFNQKFAQIF